MYQGDFDYLLAKIVDTYPQISVDHNRPGIFSENQNEYKVVAAAATGYGVINFQNPQFSDHALQLTHEKTTIH